MQERLLSPISRYWKPASTDGSKTENTRAAYPLTFITNASSTAKADHPKNIVMLTEDAFGVMTAIARLRPAQAICYFLSGITSNVPFAGHCELFFRP
ncbi:phosphoenolpyruvate carboxykinase (ATP) [Mesorhizobium sp. M0830]|uniref:phosphoenolpyruvate carboxykinase (ATP) n=1 Tax=Mesorhizobium sp. M0830 TaxID=2957008 RepID=UPI003338D680